MTHSMYIERIGRSTPKALPVRYLVSGSDSNVHTSVLSGVINNCHHRHQPLVIISNAGANEEHDLTLIRNSGYQIRNGMSGDYFLYNPFGRINAVDGLSKIRQLLDILEYDEKQKGKLTSYLNFIRHLEFLETGSSEFVLTLEKISEYCTVMAVEEKLQRLLATGKITVPQQMAYLAKYSECAAAGADFEDILFLLMPFTQQNKQQIGSALHEAVVFPLGVLQEDLHMENVILKLLQFYLAERQNSGTTVIILDKGFGDRKGLANLLNALSSNMDVHIFSEDIFTLCEPATLAMILNRFTARVYSRPLSMDSATAIERLCGDVEVQKRTYNVTYDRRWSANRPWDILLDNNKTENYGQAVATREPRYHKEMILGLAPGHAIVEYMGNSTIVSVDP